MFGIVTWLLEAFPPSLTRSASAIGENSAVSKARPPAVPVSLDDCFQTRGQQSQRAAVHRSRRQTTVDQRHRQLTVDGRVNTRTGPDSSPENCCSVARRGHDWARVARELGCTTPSTVGCDRLSPTTTSRSPHASSRGSSAEYRALEPCRAHGLTPRAGTRSRVNGCTSNQTAAARGSSGCHRHCLTWLSPRFRCRRVTQAASAKGSPGQHHGSPSGAAAEPATHPTASRGFHPQ